MVALSGLFVEIINAFDYIQGARSVFKVQKAIDNSESLKAISAYFCYHFAARLELDTEKRLTLIVPDPRISAALLMLSISKMVLVYLNYRLWSVKLKVIYAKVLDTYFLERNGNELNIHD